VLSVGSEPTASRYPRLKRPEMCSNPMSLAP